ncbi:MAG: GNAT family N-acetyltransferase [Pseudolabrys sp.]
MAEIFQARLDAHFGADHAPPADAISARVTAASSGEIRVSVTDNLAAIEQDWRTFEAQADCTVFQSFDWLSLWQRHIGAVTGVTPAIVIGRDTAGSVLFLLPLSVSAGSVARELCFLGDDLCDYNAPMLAANFPERVDRARFLVLWEKIKLTVQGHPQLDFDYINFSKMPEQVGNQPNPMLYLSVTPNASGAYLTHLEGDWETFYSAKRTSHARKGDRNKRRRLSEFGEINLFSPENSADAVRVFEILVEQKTKSFARMGVANLFAKPGYADFFRAVASDPAGRDLVHVSMLTVGGVPAAANLGLTYRGCFYHLLASYDDGEVARYGPGAAHLSDLLKFALTHGFKIFDFTIGDERYKRDWCDTELKLYDYLSASHWRGILVAMPMMVMMGLKRWIKQTPMARDAYFKVRTFIGSLTRR